MTPKRTTLAEIGRKAGVSRATVDRVVNDRPGVHPRTAALVRALLAEQGGAGRARSASPLNVAHRVAVLLPNGGNAFIDLLAEALRQRASPELAVRVVRADSLGAAHAAAALAGLAEGCEALALVALDEPAVHDALRPFRIAGKPVVSLVSPLSFTDLYAGIDNRAAGRVAAQIVARFLRAEAGAVGLLRGNTSYRGHEEREMGFRAVLGRDARGLAIDAMEETQDDNDRAFEAVSRLLSRRPDVVAIYNIGGGNRGVARALEAANRREVIYVGHDLTPHTRGYLLSGLMDAALVQSPEEVAAAALTGLGRLLDGAQARGLPATEPVPFRIVLRENLA